ncbi:ribonuclease D [Olsenella profusa]|uniref:Ribonuclease D n=1 Tax=Olsenella profusa TaxID=138595 RepID=A0ABS2EZC8_9ACTN|nr:ribonuclease D [Olsenella profusa]MBM6774050.1 ribonuclease D [Olsenella profusa]
MYLSTSEELAAFCERASTCKVLAVDTEFLREKTYYPKLCLVQVAAGDDIAAVDPLRVEDLSPLAALFQDPDVTKVFHACSQDLEVLLDGMGVVCAPVFDTQVAAAFLGMRQQVSYGSLVEAYCGVHLPKAESLTDWSRRPLDPEQLAYAEDDVRYLPGIYERMISDLTRRDRLSWVGPEMAELVDVSRLRRDPAEAYLRLRRSGSLTRRQLALAREVCAWRERAAAERDVPRKWVLSDEVVVEVCKRAPASLERLRRVRGTEQLSERDARGVLAAVERGRACPADQCPKVVRHVRPSPETEGVIDLMYAVLRLVSEKSGVAAQLIATRDDLLEFLQARDTSRLASGWRWELAGSTLERLLSGEVGLTVKDGRIELL